MEPIQEYKNIRAIYPPTVGVIPKGCYSCGENVKTDCGFVDMTKGPYKGYLCKDCSTVAIGEMRSSYLLQWAQDAYRKSNI